MITKQEAMAIRAKYDAREVWMKANKKPAYHDSELPIDLQGINNAIVNQLEVWEFANLDQPIGTRYGVYTAGNWSELTTWMGSTLMVIRNISAPFYHYGNRHSMKQWITATDSKHRVWRGLADTSSGMLVIMRRVK